MMWMYLLIKTEPRGSFALRHRPSADVRTQTFHYWAIKTTLRDIGGLISCQDMNEAPVSPKQMAVEAAALTAYKQLEHAASAWKK